MALSKTAAIREASRYCSIYGSGTSWTVTGPYQVSNPNGPYTESHTNSYEKARSIRTKWRAELALHFMDQDSRIANVELDQYDVWRHSDNSVRAIVTRALAMPSAD